MQCHDQTRQPPRVLATAPMMDCSDRHWRYLVRLFAPNALLYTEMVTAGAILHGDRGRFLRFHEIEHPIALQLGGCEPPELGECARIAEALGFDEINLNVGCPSERVQKGRFGACLMLEPDLVADCVYTLRKNVNLPVTVKCRIGVDERDGYDDLRNFVRVVAEAGCEVFIVHARKAWLSGLSPKQNREVPPLRYHDVYRLKREFEDLQIIVNGGIASASEALAHLRFVDGVMIGRAAYADPGLVAEISTCLDPTIRVAARDEILRQYMAYMSAELKRGTYLKHMARHLLGLYSGRPGAKAWRRIISEEGACPAAGLDVIRRARAQVDTGGACAATLQSVVSA